MKRKLRRNMTGKRLSDPCSSWKNETFGLQNFVRFLRKPLAFWLAVWYPKDGETLSIRRLK